jgi:hypothetical protein
VVRSNGITNYLNSKDSLVCGPEAFFYTYLSQSWELLEVDTGEELVVYVIRGLEEPIIQKRVNKVTDSLSFDVPESIRHYELHQRQMFPLNT